MNADTLKSLTDRPIAFHRAFVDITGSVCAALMLSQAVYWSKRTNDTDGWFWKTQEEWQEETGMTRWEQEGARKLIKNKGLWEEKLMGVPAKMHYRINWDAFSKIVSQSSLRKTNKLDEVQTSDKPEEKARTFISTETTSETTSLSPLPPQRASEPPIELPTNFPKTAKDAITACSTAGIPPVFIEQDWGECFARGGKDRQGHAIYNYVVHAKVAYSRHKSWQEEHKLLQPNGHNGAPRVKTMDEATVYDCL